MTVTFRANGVLSAHRLHRSSACLRGAPALQAGAQTRARAQAPQMDVIDEELDEPLAQAAGRVPSSMSQLSQLPAYVRRNSFDVQGRRCAAQTYWAALAAQPQ